MKNGMEKYRSGLVYVPPPPSLWRERNALRLSVAIIASLLLHIPIFWLISKGVPDKAPSRELKTSQVAMVSLPKAEWKNNLKIQEKQERKPEEKRVEPPKPKEKKEELTKEEKLDLKDKQIVDVAPQKDKTAPEKYDYLSEYNTRAPKETVSRHRKLDYINPAPRPSIATPPLPKGADTSSEKIAITEGGKPEKKEEQQASEEEIKERMLLKDQKFAEQLKLKFDKQQGEIFNRMVQEAIKGNAERTDIALKRMSELEKKLEQKAREGTEDAIPTDREGDAMQKSVTLSSLMPSRDSLDRIIGAPAPDHLPNVEEGDETILNTREFKYATFFNRVKKLIAQRWNPGLVYRLRDPDGSIYGLKDRHTVLQVRLKENGDLKSLIVIKPSGAPFLDDEARRAVTEAAPFPNPPDGMIENGEVTFNFGFYFEISSHPRFMMYR